MRCLDSLDPESDASNSFKLLVCDSENDSRRMVQFISVKLFGSSLIPTFVRFRGRNLFKWGRL